MDEGVDRACCVSRATGRAPFIQPQKDNYAAFYDDHQRSWSLNFSSAEEFIGVAKKVDDRCVGCTASQQRLLTATTRWRVLRERVFRWRSPPLRLARSSRWCRRTWSLARARYAKFTVAEAFT